MDVKSYWNGISLEIMQIRRKCVMKLDYIKLPALYDTLPHVMAVVISNVARVFVTWWILLFYGT